MDDWNLLSYLLEQSILSRKFINPKIDIDLGYGLLFFTEIQKAC